MDKGTFELDPTLPVRVAFGAPTKAMAETDGTSIYRVDATVDNLATGVMSAGGTCLPSPSSANASNPFGTAKQVSLTLTRVPSMHVAGDNHMVIEFHADGMSLGSDMAPSWFFGPKQLIATTPLSPAIYEGFGHGTPGSIPNITLDIVSSGGMACTP